MWYLTITQGAAMQAAPALRCCGRWIYGALWAVLLALALGPLSLAAPNLDRVQALAQERWGPDAAALVADWRKMINSARELDETARLEAVNGFFNRRLRFEDDISVWKQNDYWASPMEFMGVGAGDCEDFAIAKYVSLMLLGVPNDKLRLIYVRAQVGGSPVAHMVVGYYEDPTEEPVILDNLIGSIQRPRRSRCACRDCS
ncbi:MAG: transglutaminase-like cysteine peptidase, partial [Quisquiliibacterium sp.]